MTTTSATFADYDRAIAAAGENSGAIAHFGDPSGEQWALEESRALADLSCYQVVTVTGPDRLTWLTTLSTQILRDMAPSDSREMLLLDPSGRIRFAAAVNDNCNTTYLIVAPQTASKLVEFLNSMRFALRVEVADVSDQYVAVGAMSRRDDQDAIARIQAALAAAAAPIIWEDPWPGITPGGTTYTVGLETSAHPGYEHRRFIALLERENVHNALGRALAVLGAEKAQAPTAASIPIRGVMARKKNARLCGIDAWNAWQVAAWRPGAQGLDERSMPHEFDWLRSAVHLEKGCYCGQETVARIFNVGKPPRRLAFVHLDGSANHLPQMGAKVQVKMGDNWREVGVVTASARHCDLGPIALVLLRRATDENAPLLIEEVAGAQTPICAGSGRALGAPDLDQGNMGQRRALAHNPALRRL